MSRSDHVPGKSMSPIWIQCVVFFLVTLILQDNISLALPRWRGNPNKGFGGNGNPGNSFDVPGGGRFKGIGGDGFSGGFSGGFDSPGGGGVSSGRASGSDSDSRLSGTSSSEEAFNPVTGVCTDGDFSSEFEASYSRRGYRLTLYPDADGPHLFTSISFTVDVAGAGYVTVLDQDGTVTGRVEFDVAGAGDIVDLDLNFIGYKVVVVFGETVRKRRDLGADIENIIHIFKRDSGKSSKQDSGKGSKQDNGSGSKQDNGKGSKQDSGISSKQDSGGSSNQLSSESSNVDSGSNSRGSLGQNSGGSRGSSSRGDSGSSNDGSGDHSPIYSGITLNICGEITQVDGNWGTWSAWTCDVSCGSGIATRERDCDNPARSDGGADCSGDATETDACYEGACPVDGNWGTWGGWSCDVTCGSGTATRARACDNPEPEFEGEDCPGDETETETCNEAPCPVDGNWGTWGGWSCDVTCGTGTATRARACDNPEPEFEGEDCPGDETETETCNEAPCPVDGNWGTWGGWSSCDVTCGSGTATRARACDNPEPEFEGGYCPGDGTETETCNEAPCPVDGNWGTWGGWSSCDVTCGSGTATRARACDNPEQEFEGGYCPGDGTETETCNVAPCPVDGNWGTWGGWSSCDVTCGSGTATRARACDNPEPEFEGGYCPGDGTETETCNKAPCPVDGNWGTWGGWSSCDVTCGSGTATRARACDNPEPEFEGGYCPGDGTETETCNVAPCPVDGNWGTWGGWSSCDVTCGSGTATRARACDNPEPEFEGGYCPGDGTETETCNEAPCPVDGNWGTWGGWSSCDVTCGSGTATRARACDNPEPEFEGGYCPGDGTETETCNEAPCPVDGNWGTWGGWSCDVTCGTGTATRARACDNPAPEFEGEDCPGDETETETCNEAPCPVDGNWGTWGGWSSCDVTCGSGTVTRARACDNPEPEFEGEDCPGDETETETCNEAPCPACSRLDPSLDDGYTATSSSNRKNVVPEHAFAGSGKGWFPDKKAVGDPVWEMEFPNNDPLYVETFSFTITNPATVTVELLDENGNVVETRVISRDDGVNERDQTVTFDNTGVAIRITFTEMSNSEPKLSEVSLVVCT